MSHAVRDDEDARAARVARRAHPLVARAIWCGWGCVALSALFLWLSGPMTGGPEAAGDGVLWAVYLMLARLFGIASFAIGGLAIFNHRWTVGVLLLLISVILPFVAYQLHGTI